MKFLVLVDTGTKGSENFKTQRRVEAHFGVTW